MRKGISILCLGISLLVGTFSADAQEKIWIDSLEREVQKEEACAYLTIEKKDTLLLVSRFTPEGRKTSEAYYSRFGLPKSERLNEGRFTKFFSNGKDSLVMHFHNGFRQGKAMVFYPNGSVRLEFSYDKNQLDGDLIQYYPNGQIFRKELYNKNECEVAEHWDESGNEISLEPYLVPAKFRSDIPFWTLYSRLIKYPGEAVEKNIQGRIRVTFVIDEKGHMTHIRLKDKVHPLLDAEALRVFHFIADNYEWTPMLIEGKPVNSFMTAPITFNLK